jgi:hypothetical protein
MTREDAVETIERMKTIRPTCDKCEEASYAWARHLMTLGMNDEDTPAEFMRARGFEPLIDQAGYVKRCEACANGKRFPWADQLDPDKVVAFANSDPRCVGKAFLLELLKETL